MTDICWGPWSLPPLPRPHPGLRARLWHLLSFPHEPLSCFPSLELAGLFPGWRSPFPEWILVQAPFALAVLGVPLGDAGCPVCPGNHGEPLVPAGGPPQGAGFPEGLEAGLASASPRIPWLLWTLEDVRGGWPPTWFGKGSGSRVREGPDTWAPVPALGLPPPRPGYGSVGVQHPQARTLHQLAAP